MAAFPDPAGSAPLAGPPPNRMLFLRSFFSRPSGFGSKPGVEGRLLDGVDGCEETSSNGGGSRGSRSAGTTGWRLGFAREPGLGDLGDLGAAGCGSSGVRRLAEEIRLRTLEKRLLDSDDGAGLLLIDAADDSEDDPTEKRLDRRLDAFFFSPNMAMAGASATVIRGTESRGEV